MRNELLNNRKRILNLNENNLQENTRLNIELDDIKTDNVSSLFLENNNTDEYIEIDDKQKKSFKNINYKSDFSKLNNNIKLIENNIKLIEHNINNKNRIYAVLTILGMAGLFVINDVILIHFFN